ncbi:MAG TPA: alpha/beta hydrolase [Nevskia sp.]|nr:alpha/beta hydrolase [Nevskia sp.]
MTLDPQVKAMLDAMAAMPAADYSTLEAAQYRAMMDGPSMFAPGDAVAQVENRGIPGPGGELRLRLYRDAPGILPITLFFHGGGFVIGTLDTHDNICRCLAKRSGSLVISVDYRLAPEAPFPAAVKDACAALAWAHRNAREIGGDASRMAVAGDSAGGNLAAVAAQHWRDHGPALRHQLLLYPITDWRADTESYRSFAKGYFLSWEMMNWFTRQYLPDAKAADDLRASPLRSRDLSGLAPATVITAEYDPLRDEGEAYAHAMREAGVAVELHRWPGQVHGFASMLGAVSAADASLTTAALALRNAFLVETAAA